MAAAAADSGEAYETPLSEVAERRDLDTALLLALADSVAALHAHAEPVGAQPAIAAPFGLQRQEIERLAASLRTRTTAGRVRRGHGALDLRHVALTGNGGSP